MQLFRKLTHPLLLGVEGFAAAAVFIAFSSPENVAPAPAAEAAPLDPTVIPNRSR